MHGIALENALRVRRELPGLMPWLTLDAILPLAQLTATLGEHATAYALLDEAAELLSPIPGGDDNIGAAIAGIRRQLAPLDARPEPVESLTERGTQILRLLTR